MPEGIPQAAIDEATADLTSWMLEWGWMPGLSKDQVRQVCEDAAGRVLETAAPILAEAVAQKILAHANRRPGAGKVLAGPLAAWHRHFGIAARVAASSFSTDEEVKRSAAEAIARGDFVACQIPEDGNG